MTLRTGRGRWLRWVDNDRKPFAVRWLHKQLAEARQGERQLRRQSGSNRSDRRKEQRVYWAVTGAKNASVA
jgi:hypothetical protein